MIRIIAVGKIKEKFFEDAIAEYSKRLSAYTKLEIVQVPDEKVPEKFSEAECVQARRREGEKILKTIKDSEYVVTLEIKEKQMDSEEFAGFINELNLSGKSDIAFVIGGSTGLAQEVSDRADFKLSFSKMTFPHQLMRVVLLEQIYRGFKIIRGETYHK